MDRTPSWNNERAVPPVPKEIYVPNYLRNHVMLIEMQNSKELEEEFSSIDFLWLRRDTPWPKLVKSAVYRYLHFHDLYQVNRDHEVSKLVDYIFQNGELPNDLHCREQMIHRCRKLILSTSKWTMKGLLGFNKDNRLVKSEMFQNAWNNQLLIMRNRSSTTNLANVEQFEDTIAVERPNAPAKMSEASAVPNMSVDVSRVLPKEGHPNAPLVTSPEPEPDIKVDLDEPMSLTNEHPKLPLIPALDDTSSNTIGAIYDGPDSYCHGLPNFEFKSQDVQVPPTISASLTHVLPSQKSIVQNVVFLKDLVCHNHLSETKFLCQKVRFEASAHLFIPVANNINRFATYSAIVLIWQSDGQFLRFWRSLIDPNYTLIEFTFSSAPWLSGFTIDTNNDGDLTKARQHIWDGFWIFINIESRSLNSKFRILAKPKLPYLLSVPSKRPTDSTHDLQRPCPRGKEKESSSKKTNEREISSPRSDGQVPNGKAAPCDRSQSIGQTPIAQNLPTSSKQPVARPRVVSQQSNIALSPANAQINPPNLKQQQQQQQQQWSCQCQSPIIGDALRSHFNPSSRRSPSDPTFKTQQNHLNLQPQGGIILAEPVRFLHVNAPRISHRSLQQYPNAQSSARMIPQPPMIQAHRPLIASRFPPQVNPNPSISRLIADPSQIPPSFLNCLPLVLPYPPPSPLSPPTSPQPHDPTANSISNLTPTILFRIQLSPNGAFSRPYSRSILGVPGQPPITTAQLFTWFKNEARIGNKQGPESLTFRLKDAVPVPITYTISRSGSVDGVDRLAKLKAGIKREGANAGRLIMGLEKFEIFVSVTEEEKEIQGMEEESNQIVGEEWSDTSRIR